MGNENTRQEWRLCVAKDESDAAALKALIKEQRSLGADVPEDIDHWRYTWEVPAAGGPARLVRINWNYCGIMGRISLDAFTALEALDCYSSRMKGLDFSRAEGILI